MTGPVHVHRREPGCNCAVAIMPREAPRQLTNVGCPVHGAAARRLLPYIHPTENGEAERPGQPVRLPGGAA